MNKLYTSLSIALVALSFGFGATSANAGEKRGFFDIDINIGNHDHRPGADRPDRPFPRPPQAKPAPQTNAGLCPQGLVWRERFDGDTVCVLPGERDANRRKRGLSVGAATACPQGLVWRERFDGDTVCVTPLERDENRRRRGL
ncbi:hypothetical protein [Bradyrhizobium sp. 21]|uniref:hypothetical protein n=1 Tax=Bradyrhizobium sp. 21 TaxID=2782666 RepID=UPI001FFC03F0|nr:hypothetical protein [Bradyrhizobium sp. 21]MCK1386332.1 hypothetical protein [Bradyrhizobium sp. 21]